MSQPRDPGRNKGKDSRVKNKAKQNNAKKTSPAQSSQDREIRNKVKRIYLVTVSVCGVLIIVFSLLVTNKLKKAGVVFSPDETDQMLEADFPGENKETETAATTDPYETSETLAAETTETTVFAPGTDSTTYWNYYYSGNINIAGSVTTVTTSASSSETTTSSDPNDPDTTVETDPSGEGVETEATDPGSETTGEASTDPASADPDPTDPVPPAGDTEADGDAGEDS
jgi:hypothetical protein